MHGVSIHSRGYQTKKTGSMRWYLVLSVAMRCTFGAIRKFFGAIVISIWCYQHIMEWYISSMMCFNGLGLIRLVIDNKLFVAVIDCNGLGPTPVPLESWCQKLWHVLTVGDLFMVWGNHKGSLLQRVMIETQFTCLISNFDLRNVYVNISLTL